MAKRNFSGRSAVSIQSETKMLCSRYFLHAFCTIMQHTFLAKIIHFTNKEGAENHLPLFQFAVRSYLTGLILDIGKAIAKNSTYQQEPIIVERCHVSSPLSCFVKRWLLRKTCFFPEEEGENYKKERKGKRNIIQVCPIITVTRSPRQCVCQALRQYPCWLQNTNKYCLCFCCGNWWWWRRRT